MNLICQGSYERRSNNKRSSEKIQGNSLLYEFPPLSAFLELSHSHRNLSYWSILSSSNKYKGLFIMKIDFWLRILGSWSTAGITTPKNGSRPHHKGPGWIFNGRKGIICFSHQEADFFSESKPSLQFPIFFSEIICLKFKTFF